jgi:hypothetical protein
VSLFPKPAHGYFVSQRQCTTELGGFWKTPPPKIREEEIHEEDFYAQQELCFFRCAVLLRTGQRNDEKFSSELGTDVSGKTTMRVLDKTNDGRTLKEIEFDSVSISDDRLVYSGTIDVECPLGTSLLGVKCIVNVEASAEKSPSRVDFFQQGEVEISIGNRIVNRQPIPRALIGSSEMP